MQVGASDTRRKRVRCTCRWTQQHASADRDAAKGLPSFDLHAVLRLTHPLFQFQLNLLTHRAYVAPQLPAKASGECPQPAQQRSSVQITGTGACSTISAGPCIDFDSSAEVPTEAVTAQMITAFS